MYLRCWVLLALLLLAPDATLGAVTLLPAFRPCCITKTVGISSLVRRFPDIVNAEEEHDRHTSHVRPPAHRYLCKGELSW